MFIKEKKNSESRKVPCMPVRLMPMLPGEFAMLPDRTVSGIFIILESVSKTRLLAVCYSPSVD